MFHAIFYVVVGWPQMYPRCFPTTLYESIMGKSGIENHNIIVQTSSTTWSVTCGSRGALVRGGTFNGEEQHGTCTTVTRYQNNFGTRTVTALEGKGGIEVICAVNGQAWTYASSSGLNELDPNSSEGHYDILVIGSGMGGHAAAVSAARADPSLKIKMVSPGSSTTSRSTGVVWFPLNHTRDELLETYGADLSVPEHVSEYLETGPASYNYWKPLLNLQPFPNAFDPVPDYHSYSTGSKSNNSFQAGACGPIACGADTLTALSALADFDSETGKNVTSVKSHSMGYIVTSESTEGSLITRETSHAVIFAVGGSGHYDKKFDADFILAGTENWGIHLQTALEMGLTVVGDELRWGLEFAYISGEWAPNWFSFGCSPLGVSDYEPCHDYNRRVAAYPNRSQFNATFVSTPGGRDACAAGTSFSWWRDYFHTNVYFTDPVVLENATCGTTSKEFLADGMIDGRRTFQVAAKTMESTDLDGLFAAGTTSSYALGNSYFGPGSTLGWALHSGRLAGEAAARTAKAKSLQVKAESNRSVVPKKKNGWRIRLFRVGAWFLFVAVAVHILPRKTSLCTTKSIRSWMYTLHYILAPTAIILLLIAAISSWSQDRADRLMLTSEKTEHKRHRRLGYVVVGLLATQLVLGPLARWLNMTKRSNAALGVAHRALGWAILGSVSYLYFSSTGMATIHDVKVGKQGQRHQAIAYAVKVGLLAFSVLLFFIWDASRHGIANEFFGLLWRYPQKTRHRKRLSGKGTGNTNVLYTMLSPVRVRKKNKKLRSVFSWRSLGSVASLFSFGSALSVAAVACMGCLMALGSIGSVGSIFSVGSIGSVLSFNSTFSVLAHSCHLGIFHDCRLHGPQILWSRVPRKSDPYAMWAACRRTPRGAKLHKDDQGSAGFEIRPGSVGRCGSDTVFNKERIEVRTGSFSRYGKKKIKFDVQVDVASAPGSHWLSIFQVKCSGVAPPPYMLILGSENYPSMLQVRHKPDWGTTNYLPLLNQTEWGNGQRLQVEIDLDLSYEIFTTVRNRHGVVVNASITGASLCEGRVYLKFGFYRERHGSGGHATMLVNQIFFYK